LNVSSPLFSEEAKIHQNYSSKKSALNPSRCPHSNQSISPLKPSSNHINFEDNHMTIRTAVGRKRDKCYNHCKRSNFFQYSMYLFYYL